jgi:hypothetical protein
MHSIRLRTFAIAVALAVGSLVLMPAISADAARVPVYKNCTAVHQKYKGGIAKNGAKDKRRGGGHAKYKPYVNTALYLANKKMDADKDGIACEQ